MPNAMDWEEDGEGRWVWKDQLNSPYQSGVEGDDPPSDPLEIRLYITTDKRIVYTVGQTPIWEIYQPAYASMTLLDLQQVAISASL